MRALQRVTAILGWLTLSSASGLSLLEASSQIDESWRIELAMDLNWVAEPTIPQWSAVLLGVLLAVVGILSVAAQFAPSRRVVKSVTIDGGATGSTEITAATVYRRIGAQLSELPEVYSVSAIPNRRRLKFRVELTDTGPAGKTAALARESLDAGLWSSLGIEPRPVDLLMTYRRSATPVTRKEQLV